MLSKRIISGSLMALSIGLGIFFIPSLFLGYFLALMLSISCWEFFNLRFSSFASLVLSLILLSFFIFLPYQILLFQIILFLGVFFWLILVMQIIIFPLNKAFLQNKFLWLSTGLITHFTFWVSFNLIMNDQNSILLSFGLDITSRGSLFLLVCLSALMDSLAYYGGRKMGRRKFLSNISPNKTLEGFLFAIIFSPLILLILLSFIGEIETLSLYFVLLVGALFSVLGDAFASLFKRISGVKDFSNLIPGHGGVLDRIDSHMACFPAFLLIIYLINTFF